MEIEQVQPYEHSQAVTGAIVNRNSSEDHTKRAPLSVSHSGWLVLQPYIHDTAAASISEVISEYFSSPLLQPT